MTDSRHAALALALLLPAPTLGAAMAIGIMPGPIGQAVYFGAKVWLIALPVVWRLLVERRPISFSPARRGGFGVAIGVGLLIAAIIVGAFEGVGWRLVDRALLADAVARNQLDIAWRYLGLAIYLTIVNALMEEYVWRWFVYEKFREVGVGVVAAVLLSAAGFTLHHFVALKLQFGWSIALLGSLGVFIGGATWSWLYARYQSIWPAYVSHAIVDVAVFYVGWRLIFAG